MVFGKNVSQSVFNISGTSSSVTLEKVYLGLHYQIAVVAWSSAGSSDSAAIYRHVTGATSPVLPNTFWNSTALIFIVSGSLFFLILFSAVLFFTFRQMAKRERKEKRSQYFKELDEKIPKYLDPVIVDNLHGDLLDKWEININNLSLGPTLGQGAFGLVRKGWLKLEDSESQEVAVKMLQEFPTSDEKRQFMQEIDIMKSVGPHKHLVSLIGCCIRKSDLTPLLVVEFCSRGDLKTYLQCAWEAMTNQ